MRYLFFAFLCQSRHVLRIQARCNFELRAPRPQTPGRSGLPPLLLLEQFPLLYLPNFKASCPRILALVAVDKLEKSLLSQLEVTARGRRNWTAWLSRALLVFWFDKTPWKESPHCFFRLVRSIFAPWAFFARAGFQVLYVPGLLVTIKLLKLFSKHHSICNIVSTLDSDNTNLVWNLLVYNLVI